MKIEKKDMLHIVIIVVGTLFLAIPILHSNLWFDESYSVAICNHNFDEIWTIGANDVHPVLYYWVLHIINNILGNNILAYRLFSWLCACIIGVLGFTHIRKDFSKNTGILFSLANSRIFKAAVGTEKSIIISTNLSLQELRDRYSDRIFSRITSNFKLCKITGPDIRMYKKRLTTRK